jgi:hypothetical protein
LSLKFPNQENTMNKLTRNSATALLLFSMTAVTLADGQMDLPLTSPSTTAQTCTTSQSQTDATLQGQMDTPPATSPTTGETTVQMDTSLTEAGQILFQSFSSIL